MRVDCVRTCPGPHRVRWVPSASYLVPSGLPVVNPHQPALGLVATGLPEVNPHQPALGLVATGSTWCLHSHPPLVLSRVMPVNRSTSQWVANPLLRSLGHSHYWCHRNQFKLTFTRDEIDPDSLHELARRFW